MYRNVRQVRGRSPWPFTAKERQHSHISCALGSLLRRLQIEERPSTSRAAGVDRGASANSVDELWEAQNDAALVRSQ